MLPIRERPEPASFEAMVRVPGARFLARKGLLPPVASKAWSGGSYWTKAQPDLFAAYGGICAFSGMGIHAVTGSRTVEHFRPKRLYPGLAYEWSNLRLVSGRMNGRKQDFEDVLDPFSLRKAPFQLNALSGEISVSPDCPKSKRRVAKSTIDRLRLNDDLLKRQRQSDAIRILDASWTREEAARQSPFVLACLQEDGLVDG